MGVGDRDGPWGRVRQRHLTTPPGGVAVDQVDALAEAFADSQSAARRIPERLAPKILSAEIGKELQKYVSE